MPAYGTKFMHGCARRIPKLFARTASAGRSTPGEGWAEGQDGLFSQFTFGRRAAAGGYRQGTGHREGVTIVMVTQNENLHRYADAVYRLEYEY